jgi:hypothetical protein
MKLNEVHLSAAAGRNQRWELLRLLMQGYLDQRSKAEVKQAEVVGTDEKVRTHCRPKSRALKTLFGKLYARINAWRSP